MTRYVIAAPLPAAVPVEGSDAVYPVRRIVCVGRNYAAHRKEMGGDDREAPFFFAKPADAVRTGGEVAYPSATANLHHEVELVVALKAGGADIPVERALDCVFGYAVGVDLTRRDLQSEARDRGYPWDAAKGFDASAPIGALRAMDGAPPAGEIRLEVNGQPRQQAELADMIWNVAEIIAQASKLWSLAAGDLVYTGTPDGVGVLVRGDVVTARIAALPSLRFTVI